MDCKITILAKINMNQLSQSLGMKEKNTVSQMWIQNILSLEDTDNIYYDFFTYELKGTWDENFMNWFIF